MNEYQKLIDQNKVFADYIKTHNLTDDEIKELKLDADKFIFKILNSKTLYDNLLKEVYTDLKNIYLCDFSMIAIW